MTYSIYSIFVLKKKKKQTRRDFCSLCRVSLQIIVTLFSQHCACTKVTLPTSKSLLHQFRVPSPSKIHTWLNPTGNATGHLPNLLCYTVTAALVFLLIDRIDLGTISPLCRTFSHSLCSTAHPLWNLMIPRHFLRLIIFYEYQICAC